MGHPRHMGHTPNGIPGNRAQRRAARRTPPAVAAYASSYECPDCDADSELSVDDLGIWHLTIRHDSTCPWLAAYERTTR